MNMYLFLLIFQFQLFGSPRNSYTYLKHQKNHIVILYVFYVLYSIFPVYKLEYRSRVCSSSCWGHNRRVKHKLPRISSTKAKFNGCDFYNYKKALPRKWIAGKLLFPAVYTGRQLCIGDFCTGFS